MSKRNLVRAWKDPIYRSGLDAADRDRIGHPSGLVELSDEQLRSASGIEGLIVTTFKTCTEFTLHKYRCCN